MARKGVRLVCKVHGHVLLEEGDQSNVQEERVNCNAVCPDNPNNRRHKK